VSLVKLKNALKERVRLSAAELFGIELDEFPVEVPPRTELGDAAFPVAFELAKRIKQ
jgi:arginyl-tRNA synthetase